MNTPTIIIGLGGTGCKIVNEVSSRITGNMRDNLLVACFDTDVNDIKELKHIKPENIFQTSTDRKVGTYLKVDEQAKEWFPDSPLLDEHNLTQGAAQFRVISRLALRAAIREGKLKKLSSQIANLFVRDENVFKVTPRVFIVCTLAGGTGSGIFLQMGAIMRTLLTERGIEKFNLFGLFILPSIITESNENNVRDLSVNQKTNMKANGFAAIKELAAVYKYNYNGIDTDSFKLEFEFDVKESLIDKNRALPKSNIPYDFVFLFDRDGDDKKNLGGGIIPYYKQVEETLFLLAASRAGERSLSIANNELLKLIQSNGYARFCGSAVSRLIYPVDDMARFCALKWIAGNISEQWSETDRRFMILINEYNKAKLQGREYPRPNRREHYLQTIPSLAKDQVLGKLFKRLYNQTFAKRENGEIGAPKSGEFLSSIEKFIEEQLQNTPKYKYFTGKKLETESLKEPVQADNEIASYERNLSDFKTYVFELVHTIKVNVTSTILPDKDYKETIRKNAVDLTNLFSGGADPVHPVAIRYILYDLQSQIEKKLALIKTEAEGLEKAIEKYESSYDDPGTDEQESAVDRLRAAKQQNWLKKVAVKNKYKQFTEEYVQKAQRQKTNISKYAKEKTLEMVLEELTGGISIMNSLLESFFDNIVKLESELLDEADVLNNKHHKPADSSNSFVLSDKNYSEVLIQGKTERETIKLNGYKEKIWAERKPFYDDQDLPKEVLEGIFYMIYDTFIETYRSNKKSGKQKNALLDSVEKFKQQVVPLGAEKLKTDPQINMNLLQALRKEAELNGKYEDEDIQKYVSSRINGITLRADTPLLKLNPDVRHEENTKFQFWGVNEALAASLPSQTSMNGEIVADNAFDPYAIVYANSTVCFTIDEVEAFNDNDPENKFAIGTYFEVYKERIRKLHLSERSSENGKDKDVMKFFTPHLDKRWHKRSYLPEVRVGFNKVSDILARETFLLGLIYDEFVHSPSGETESGFGWKQFVGDEFVVLRDEYGKAVSGTFNSLLNYLLDNPEAVDELLKEGSIKAKKDLDTSSDAKSISKRKFYTGSRKIEFKDKDLNILDVLATIISEKKSTDSERLAELLFKDYADDISAFYATIFGKEKVRDAQKEYLEFFETLKKAGKTYNKLEPTTIQMWDKIIDTRKPKA